MASAPNSGLPLFYNDLQPISSNVHGDWKAHRMDRAPFLAKTHAVPLTIEEFSQAQRFFPIVFSVGPNPVPLALMGLNEGVNVFVNDDGQLTTDVYVPAYVRRYPFMLARLRPDAEELSLCFDPTAEAIGPFEEGDPLFEGAEPAQATRDILAFCERFEQAGQQTGAFVQELIANKLLIDGEVSIQPDGVDQPFVYRGFQMISEEALRNLRGDVLRKMNQSGLLPLAYAHLFSLAHVREIFSRQMSQGKVPTNPDAVAAS